MISFINNALILELISVSLHLFIFAASLSAGMTSSTSAPSILKAVIDDDIIPFLSELFCINNNNFYKSIENKMMYCSFIIEFSCNLLGKLNMVPPLITSMSKSAGWRPLFQYYHKYLALFGSFLCVIVMILSDWIYAIVSLIISFCLFQYI